jgi:Fe2+ transport system protein FeoA
MTPTPKESKSELPLNKMPVNRKGEIISVTDGTQILNSDEKLSEMGLIRGTIIEKVGEMPLHGPVQIFVKGTRIAIGYSIARRIMVRLV